MQIGIWDESLRLEKLSQLGDSLEKLNKVIDWEMFRPILDKATEKEDKGVGGRPPFDNVMKFKIASRSFLPKTLQKWIFPSLG